MNVLVTGATGFVGTALLKRMGHENFNVRAAVLAGEQTSHLPSAVEKALVQPLSNTAEYADALRGIDIVVHLAARVHVMNEHAVDPLAEYRMANVSGTERLARQAASAGVRRLVFLSSAKVNGEGRPALYTEDDPPSPEDPYSISKREAEDALRRVERETGLEVVIIRPPLVYGPGVKANFRRLLEMVVRGIPLPLGCIRNRRSLIGLGNLADAIVVCSIHQRAAGNTYLVSDGDAISTPELVRQIAAALGRPARLFPLPLMLMRLAGVMTGKGASVERISGSLMVDSGKIRRELNWEPPLSMAQGLAETADWFLNHR